MFKKSALFFTVLLITFCNYQIAFTQEGGCSKPKVAVKLTKFYDPTYDVLIRQYPPFQTKEYWLKQIKDTMLEKLKANSPGVAIFSADSGLDYEYDINYFVELYPCGEEIKIGDILSNKDTCYHVHGNLSSKDACNIEGVGFRNASIIYKDIYTAVTLFALQMGNLETITAAHERARPIPPRGPRMKITVDPNSVSPLDEERESTIEARVTNCKGEPVYDKIGKRYGVIAGPKETGCGETVPTIKKGAYEPYGNNWRISPNAQGEVSLKYTLKKGVNPGTEKIQFTACGLGSKVSEEVEIKIKGLKINVSPKRKEISSGESTQVVIEFLKVDTEGHKEPVAGKQIQVKVEGLIDGTVSPSGNVVTDQNGKAILTYRAGYKEKQVTFKTKYQPKDFKEFVEDESVINVNKPDITLNITGTANWKRDDIRYTSELAMQIRITGTMKLKWAGKDALDYEPERMMIQYYHRGKVVDKERGCIAADASGVGSFSISEGSFILSFRRGQLMFKFNLKPLELHVKRMCGRSLGDETRKATLAVNMIMNEKLDRNQMIFSGKRTWKIPDLQKDLNRPSDLEGLFYVIPFMQNEFDASKILEQFGVKAPATIQPYPSPGPDMKLEWKFEKTKSDDQKAGSDNDRSERRKKRGSKKGNP